MDHSDHTPPVIAKIENVSKRFTIRHDNSLKERILSFGRAGRAHREDFWALSDISFQVRAGTTMGLIGHNGSGKSTLLKVLGGIIQPDIGSVERRGRLAALLELGAGFHPDLTGRENVFLNASLLGLTRQETELRFDEIVAFSEIGDFIDTQVKFYSSGMYVRLAFSVAVHTDPDLLLVDEVLAVGDEAFQQKCLNKIEEFQREGRTIIIVTHSLSVVEELCDSAIVLDHGRIVFSGDSRDAVESFRKLLHKHELDERESVKLGRRNGQIDSVEVVQEAHSARVEVSVSSESSLRSWALGVRIRAQDGYPVFSVDNTQTGVVLGELGPHGKKIVFDIETESFASGTYQTEVILFSQDWEEIDVLPRAAVIKIVRSSLTLGVVAAEVRVSEVPL